MLILCLRKIFSSDEGVNVNGKEAVWVYFKWIGTVDGNSFSS